MSKFFVGQRVRIARDLEGGYPELTGKESVVVRIGICDLGDGFDIELALTDDYAFHPGELEPIQPSGAAPSEYSLTELMDRCRAGEGIAA